jgi:Putative zinc-finger
MAEGHPRRARNGQVFGHPASALKIAHDLPRAGRSVAVRAPQTDEFACEELVELVTDYLDGVLPPELKDKFHTHLAGCDGCDEYVRQIGVTIRALKEADLHLVPAASRDPDLSDR